MNDINFECFVSEFCGLTSVNNMIEYMFWERDEKARRWMEVLVRQFVMSWYCHSLLLTGYYFYILFFATAPSRLTIRLSVHP